MNRVVTSLAFLTYFTATACSVTVGNPFNDTGKNDNSTQPQYDDEKFVSEEAFDGAYLACSRPTEVTLEGATSIMGCGFISEDNSEEYLSIDEAVDSWSIQSDSQSSVILYTSTQSSVEFPIHIILSGTMKDINSYTQNMSLTFNLEKGDLSSSLRVDIITGNSDDAENISRGLSELGIESSYLSSTIIYDENSPDTKTKVGLRFNKVNDKEILDLSAFNLLWAIEMSDGSVAFGSGDVINEANGTSARYLTSNDDDFHAILEIEGDSQSQIASELKSLKVRLIINGKTFFSGNPASRFEILHGGKRLFLNNDVEMDFVEARVNCKSLGAETISIGDVDLQNSLGAFTKLYGEIWIGLEDMKNKDNRYHWDNGATKSFLNHEVPIISEHNRKDARCMVIESESPHKWMPRTCRKYKTNFFCQESI